MPPKRKQESSFIDLTRSDDEGPRRKQARYLPKPEDQSSQPSSSASDSWTSEVPPSSQTLYSSSQTPRALRHIQRADSSQNDDIEAIDLTQADEDFPRELYGTLGKVGHDAGCVFR
jgi:hypothetical protein